MPCPIAKSAHNLPAAKGDLITTEIWTTIPDVGLHRNKIAALHMNSKEMTFPVAGTAPYEFDGVTAVDVVNGHTIHADLMDNVGGDNGKTPAGVVPFIPAKEVKVASPLEKEKKESCGGVDGYASVTSEHELGVDPIHHRGVVRSKVDTKDSVVRNVHTVDPV